MVGRELRESVISFLTHGIVKGALEIVLMLGFLYFAFAGSFMLIFNTESYWMAVVSDSMTHEAADEYWKAYFEDEQVRNLFLLRQGVRIPEDRLYDTSGFPIAGGFSRGDLLIIKGISSVSEISVGDVLIINRPYDIPLTHRVLAVWEEDGEIGFTTKGDRNPYLISEDRAVRPEQIVGKVIFVVPKLGSISLWFQGR
jgi:hypothetical protein